MKKYNFELFANYFQFCIQDETADGDLSSSWTQEAGQRLLALAPGTLGIGTVSSETVPVCVEIHETEPGDNVDDWDQVIECGLNISSGKIVVAGRTDYFPEAARVEVPSGSYRARIFYGGLDPLSRNGLEGREHYRIVLWPSSNGDTVKVLKQWRKK